MNDLRYSVRTLARMRGVAVVAVATLALGIAATTTMFSGAYAALLRPVPFADPDRLVLLFTTRSTAREGLVLSRWSRPLIDMLTASVSSYESIASFSAPLVSVSGGNGDPEQIDAEIVSPDYFRTLRVAAVAGRTFTPAEDGAPGAAPVVILSDRLWRRRYSADPSVLDSTIRINDVPMTVIGIMPPGFSGLSDKSELWIPRTMAPRLTYAEYLTTPQLFIGVVARLKNDVTLERANAELTAASAAFPVPSGFEDARWSAVAQRAGDARVEPVLRRSVLLLLGAAACVLLITCANVAGLLLARGRMRRRELAIRMAIGAGRARIVRQLLTESLVLAVAAGACGTLLAMWGVQLFARYAPAMLWTGRVTMATFAAPVLDARALLFALGITLLTSVLCGVAPAIDTSRTQLTHALKEDERGGGPPRRLFKALVIAEIALALPLLAAAGLLLDSFTRMQRLRGGFESDGVLTFWVRPPASRYHNSEGPAVVERLLSAVERVPGVDSAAVNRCTPFTGCSRTTLHFTDRAEDPESAPVVGRHYVSADYFRTLGIPLVAGRALTPADRADRPPVTVISESAARRYWPGESALGKRVWFGGTTGPFADRSRAVEIVGVVGDVKYEAVDWPNSTGRPEFYTSYLQFSYPDTMVMVKTRGSTSALVPALRRAVASVDPALPIYDVLTLDDRVSGALSRPRFNAALVAGFAGVALFVAALGIYGMLSYSVSSRLREIGVRLALGAAPDRIVRVVLLEGLRLAVLGVIIGLFAAVALGRVTRSLLIDVSPTEPVVLAIVTVLMLGVATLAVLLPARRASAVDPIVVLRQE
ncbi:MAG TPA: ABC transporter permease [Vicinamibacterales bacterium]|nr:ABC transporter permease [Vicinamibacterales bacterium]